MTLGITSANRQLRTDRGEPAGARRRAAPTGSTRSKSFANSVVDVGRFARPLSPTTSEVLVSLILGFRYSSGCLLACYRFCRFARGEFRLGFGLIAILIHVAFIFGLELLAQALGAAAAHEDEHSNGDHHSHERDNHECCAIHRELPFYEYEARQSASLFAHASRKSRCSESPRAGVGVGLSEDECWVAKSDAQNAPFHSTNWQSGKGALPVKNDLALNPHRGSLDPRACCRLRQRNARGQAHQL